MTRILEQRLQINAPARIVYALLTEAAGLLEWMGVEAETEQRPGGRIWWRHANGDACSGQFLELMPHSRVVFTYGWEREDVGIAPGSTLVEIDLAEQEGVTTVTLLHKGLSEPARLAHTHGWAHYLGRLAARAEGGDVTPDPLAGSRVPSFRER
ncbi:MAG: SRPBCC domain-containing protein [Chloroflexota bacterium]